MKAQSIIILITFVFSVYSYPISQANQPRSKAWTFMVYSCADCDLEGYQLGYMTKMASVGSTAEVNIVMQMDRIDGYSTEYGDWTDCKRFYVTQGLMPTEENALSSLGEVSMGDPNTLCDFLTWAVQEYPADRYFAMIIGHGWLDGVCPDWSGGGMLTPLEIRWVLSHVKNTTGVEIDVIGIEGCQQAALEIAYEIGDYANLIIASEEVSTHWPYNYILSDLVDSNGTMNASSVASMIVDYYSQYSWMGGDIMTLSAFNLSRVKTEVATATTNLADYLIANITRFAHAIAEAATRAESHEPIWSVEEAESCRDLYDFALEIEQGIADDSIQLAAQNLIHAIEDACIAEWHGPGHPDFHGLYIYLPDDEDVYNARTSIYSQSYFMAHPLWTQDTTWEELLFLLFKTYAAGLKSHEQIANSFFTSFDSNNDSYLDALHIGLDLYTTGEPISITAYSSLIDPQGTMVDQCNNTWIINSAGSSGDIYLYMPSDGEEGLYDVEVSVYDEYGVFEDDIYMPQIAFLPEEMQHDLSAYGVSIVRSLVGQGYPTWITVTIGNQGHYYESANVTTYANGTLVDTTQQGIPAGSNITFTVQWDTTGQSLGNYTITSFIEPVDGENNTIDNNFQYNENVCVTLPGDVDADQDIDIFDIVKIAETYGTIGGEPRFEINYDINGDGKIDIFDIVIATSNYGMSW